MEAMSANRGFSCRRIEPFRLDLTGLPEKEVLNIVERCFTIFGQSFSDDLVIGAMRVLLSMVGNGSFKAMDMCRWQLDPYSTFIESYSARSRLFAYCKKEHERGQQPATLCLGLMYLNGFGVEKNPAAAFNYYKEADDGRCIFAAAQIGLLYEKAGDNLKAIEYYKKGADSDEMLSMNALANIYSKGLIVKKDYLEAYKYLLKSAPLEEYRESNALWDMTYELVQEKAFSPALIEIVLSHISQMDAAENVLEDFYRGAFEYCIELAEKGENCALFNILNLIRQLIDKKDTDPTFAAFVVIYFENLAAVPFALVIVGEIYLNGSGVVEQNLAMAFKYLKKALDSEDLQAPHAIRKLAGEFSSSRSGYLDYSGALMCYRLLEEKGNQEAKNAILDMFLKNLAVNDDPEFTLRILREFSLEENENAEKAKLKLAEFVLKPLKRRNDSELSQASKKMRNLINKNF
ncbi:MAG: sel1 repeat family protein [Solimicrobium sp.]|nr:sel1 repeat family protein [Solimicrobium sp.]